LGHKCVFSNLEKKPPRETVEVEHEIPCSKRPLLLN
jgi:hypothetical protein